MLLTCILKSKENSKKLFYNLEIFLRCRDFSMMQRLLLQSTLWRLFYSEETFIAVYGVETFIAVYGVETFLLCRDFWCKQLLTGLELLSQIGKYVRSLALSLQQQSHTICDRLKLQCLGLESSYLRHWLAPMILL